MQSPLAGYQTWRSLLFLHWPCDAAVLRRLVPQQLQLDLWQGVAYIGVVAFEIPTLRLCWWPRWCRLRFLETNVRTYVRWRERPGVFFFSLDANSLPAVIAARRLWGLPYYHARLTCSEHAGWIDYAVRRRAIDARLRVRYRPARRLGPSPPGTLDHFLLERYQLFVVRRGQVFCTEVEHEPYDAHDAELGDCCESLIAAAGLPPASGSPEHVRWVPAVDVRVSPPYCDER